jgi:NAD(P)H-nitrite reductase large subunit
MDDSQPLHPAIRGLKTVCRCNNIKYRTIERAIREGACTVAEVATRTGATTGHCGGSCTPDVLEMLAEYAGTGAAAGRACVKIPAENQGSVPANDWWVRKT